ncbi:MAG TPA: protease pro-enzyme activation domain-containing protein, partial [Verrucomicrobiae bacterium]
MSKFFIYMGRLGLLITIFGFFTGVAIADNDKVITGHIPRALSRLSANGALASTNQMALSLGLPLRDAKGLDQFLHDVYDPTNPSYREFLTPEEFADRFGPSEADYEQVKDFARRQGFTITATHASRLAVDVVGDVATVQRA